MKTSTGMILLPGLPGKEPRRCVGEGGSFPAGRRYRGGGYDAALGALAAYHGASSTFRCGVTGSAANQQKELIYSVLSRNIDPEDRGDFNNQWGPADGPPPEKGNRAAVLKWNERIRGNSPGLPPSPAPISGHYEHRFGCISKTGSQRES